MDILEIVRLAAITIILATLFIPFVYAFVRVASVAFFISKVEHFREIMKAMKEGDRNGSGV